VRSTRKVRSEVDQVEGLEVGVERLDVVDCRAHGVRALDSSDHLGGAVTCSLGSRLV